MTPICILVVEGDEDVRELFRIVLTDAGYQVWTCTDAAGVEARAMELQPALIELSLWLEQPADGLALIAALAGNPATCAIPLLIATGDTVQLRDHTASWRAQGYGVLAKPFELNELLTLVRSLLAAPPAA